MKEREVSTQEAYLTHTLKTQYVTEIGSMVSMWRTLKT